LEEIVNSWNEELETQVAEFQRQSIEIAQWDQKIIKNGEKIVAFNERVLKIEALQSELDQNLAYVSAQQSELEGLLDGIDKELPALVAATTRNSLTTSVDLDRDRTFEMAEQVQNQVSELTTTLSQMVREVNSASESSSNSVPDTSQPVVDIVQILNAHLDTLQWIDQQVDDLKKSTASVARLSDRALTEHSRIFNNNGSK